MAKKNPAELYLLSLESQQSRISMRSYLNRAIQIISGEDSVNKFDWSSLTYEMVYNLKDTLSKEKKAPDTINAYLSCFKGAAKEAWRLKYINIETYQHIQDVKRVKGSRNPKGRALSIKELNIILDHCMSQDGLIAMRDAAVIALTYGAGLRRSEAANLPMSAYNRKYKEITVLGKGNKERINALNDRVIDIVDCWLDERGREPGPLFVRIYKGNRMTHDQITGQTVYDIIIKRYKEAGLIRMTPHDLRKTYATNLLENGEDIFTVQELMGHASLDTTKIYDKRGDKKTKKASKALPL
ncbi:MAG: tyrosine-type recombinase/integrase [Gammaproteobacteria bacterium]|nr:tyrosine-type recombinase/integrase [Gammaproteobacteria bacterium]